MGELLGVAVELLHLRVDVRQFLPAAHPGELCRIIVAVRQNIFESKRRRGVFVHGLERHILQEIRRSPENRSVGRIGAINRPKVRAILVQRLRHAAHQRFVLVKQLNVPLSLGRIDSLPVAIGRYEEMLDHAVRAQQVDATQKHLRVRRDGLTNGAGQREPRLLFAALQCPFVSAEQRDETLNQQGEIEGIRCARAQNHAFLIDRFAFAQAVVTDLRGQMPAKHSCMCCLNFDRVPFRQRFRDVFCDFEIGRQLIRRGALRQRDQPSRIPHENRLLRRGGSPEPIEQILNKREPIAGFARAGIPKAHAQQLQAPNRIKVEQGVRASNATAAARPASLLPEVKAAHHHFRRIDEVVVQPGNLARPESTGPMRLFQLAAQAGLLAGDAGECEEAILEVTSQKGTVLQVLNRLALGVQHAFYFVDDSPAIGQEEPLQLDMSLKRHLAVTFACHLAWLVSLSAS